MLTIDVARNHKNDGVIYMEQPEQFDLGLEECIVETSPDFEDLSTAPPKKKQQRKVATKEIWERLVK